MKVTFYVDVRPYHDETWAFVAFSRPERPRPSDAIRYSFTVELPDPVLQDFDLGEVAIEGSSHE